MADATMTTPDRTTRRQRRRVVVRLGRVGFTLAELLVAVGLVAVLTLGIGRIFASVSKLVGTGAAVGELDQIARVLETQLRADFLAASRLRADENFLAIRMRRVGDLNGDGTLDPSDEVDIYFTRDDEEADRRRGADPYERGPNGLPISRATSVRLDQIMFLGASSEGYRSFQPPPASEQVVPHALIMWGHGLRPPVDAEDVGMRARFRLNYPDGDFGFALGDENPFAPSDNQFSGKATGRNRYASDFVLTRRAVVLAGGSAAGEERVVTGSRFTPLWGKDTEVALLPRDIEASYLFASGAPFGRIFGDVDEADEERASEGDGGPDGWNGISILPNPRLLRHGRTDILAVDRQGLQQWIEGIGVPFSTGRLADSAFTDPPIPPPNNPPIDPTPLNTNLPNSRLWVVRDGINVQSVGLPRDQYEENLRGVQSGIAGMFHRVLVDPAPPTLRVDPDDPAIAYPDPPSPYAKPDATDRRMDLHAVIASRCSSFEVAWSDGSTWVRDAPLRVDANGDGVIDRDIRRGDTIWFDMDFTVRDFWRLNSYGTGPTSTNARIYPRPNPDPEIGLDDERTFDEMPNRFPGSVRTDQTHDNALVYRANKSSALITTPDTLPAYSPHFNHAPFTPDGTARPEQEYLAIWGFRTPEGADQGPDVASVGGYDRPWPKPRLIRVRVTLHDSQNRIEGGKQFEFVFRLDAEGT
jgi:type II secretory pathway pseudopilin PulG